MGFHRIRVMVQNFFWSTHIAEQQLLSMFPLILTFNFDLIFKLRRGASITRLVCLSLGRSVCLSVRGNFSRSLI